MKIESKVIAIIGLYTLSILLFTIAYAQDMKKEIILGCETSHLTAPVWIAKNNRYFQEEGINVKIMGFDSGKASFVAMLNQNNNDISTVAQTPIMFNSFHRKDFAIIAAMVNSDNDVKVLVRRDRGIKNPSDLRGKKVGMTKARQENFF